MEKNENLTVEILRDLEPQELEPRLGLQVLVDALAAIADASTDVNCRDGGNCNVPSSLPPTT